MNFNSSADATPYCQANPTAMVAMSDNCAQYIDCSLVVKGNLADPVQECKYPDLFSRVTLMCVNFTTVPSCDTRREPMAPCKAEIHIMFWGMCDSMLTDHHNNYYL